MGFNSAFKVLIIFLERLVSQITKRGFTHRTLVEARRLRNAFLTRTGFVCCVQKCVGFRNNEM